MISKFLTNGPTSKNKEYQPNLKKMNRHPCGAVDPHQHTHPLSSMPKKQKIPDKFRFVTEKSLKREKYEITRWQSTQLRSKLPQFIYWHQIEKGGLIQWN